MGWSVATGMQCSRSLTSIFWERRPTGALISFRLRDASIGAKKEPPPKHGSTAITQRKCGEVRVEVNTLNLQGMRKNNLPYESVTGEGPKDAATIDQPKIPDAVQ